MTTTVDLMFALLTLATVGALCVSWSRTDAACQAYDAETKQ